MSNRVTILCDNRDHPIYPVLEQWTQLAGRQFAVDIELVHQIANLAGGELLFLVSCAQIVKPEVRDLYRHCLVLHASDLPSGRGWSPHIWQILEGRDWLTVTLLEARDPVDTGAIWAQKRLKLEGTEVYSDINQLVFDAEIGLMEWALEHYQTVVPRPQEGEATYYRRRTPADSELDPNQPLIDLMPLLRVSDPVRFPAYFYYKGQKYTLSLQKVEEQ